MTYTSFDKIEFSRSAAILFKSPQAMENTPDRKRKLAECDLDKRWEMVGRSKVCTTEVDRERKLNEIFSTEKKWEKISKTRFTTTSDHFGNELPLKITQIGKDYLRYGSSCYLAPWGGLCTVDYARVKRVLILLENCELSKKQLKTKIYQRLQEHHAFWDRQVLLHLDDVVDLCLNEKFIS